MKQLTGREKQLICVAIDAALEKDKLLKELKDEYDVINDKINFELTSRGNRIRRGFSYAGCNGTELDIFSKLRGQGYSEFYYSAPYSWGIVNIAERKIFTYCEGDTALVECKSDRSFKAELLEYWKFQLENNPRSLDKDSVENMNKAGLKVLWSEVKAAQKED